MSKQLTVSKNQWNKEFASGRWIGLDADQVERARHAIIGDFCQAYFPNGAILDVGCGEGTLFDFLTSTQRKKYLGLDISEEAVKLAKNKRGGHFQCLSAEDFQTKKNFEVIVFNEVLYYLDDQKILEQYEKFLSKNGLFIVSLYRMSGKRYDISIFSQLKKQFEIINIIEITGKIKNQKVTWKIIVAKKRS